jgi:DNA-binding phage protein
MTIIRHSNPMEMICAVNTSLQIRLFRNMKTCATACGINVKSLYKSMAVKGYFQSKGWNISKVSID